MPKVRIWDLPTRFFHWSLVCLVVLLWWTAENGHMEWHLILAYCLGTLLFFRIIWGFIGSQTARFSDFILSPRRTYLFFRYMQPHIGSYQGHNPIAGYMVVALLSSLTLQFISGLFVTDDVVTEGPLYTFVSSEWAEKMTWFHHNQFNFLMALIGLHVLAVIFHLCRGDNLLGAMLFGKRHFTAPRDLFFRPAWLAWIVLLIILCPVGYFLIWPIMAFL